MPGQEGRAALTGSDRWQVPQGKGRWPGAWPEGPHKPLFTASCSERRQTWPSVGSG